MIVKILSLPGVDPDTLAEFSKALEGTGILVTPTSAKVITIDTEDGFLQETSSGPLAYAQPLRLQEARLGCCSKECCKEEKDEVEDEPEDVDNKVPYVAEIATKAPLKIDAVINTKNIDKIVDDALNALKKQDVKWGPPDSWNKTSESGLERVFIDGGAWRNTLPNDAVTDLPEDGG